MITRRNLLAGAAATTATTASGLGTGLWTSRSATYHMREVSPVALWLRDLWPVSVDFEAYTEIIQGAQRWLDEPPVTMGEIEAFRSAFVTRGGKAFAEWLLHRASVERCYLAPR